MLLLQRKLTLNNKNTSYKKWRQERENKLKTVFQTRVTLKLLQGKPVVVIVKESHTATRNYLCLHTPEGTISFPLSTLAIYFSYTKISRYREEKYNETLISLNFHSNHNLITLTTIVSLRRQSKTQSTRMPSYLEYSSLSAKHLYLM